MNSLGIPGDLDQGKERKGGIDIPFIDAAGNKAKGYIMNREIDAVKIENRARTLLGRPQRLHYGEFRIPKP